MLNGTKPMLQMTCVALEMTTDMIYFLKYYMYVAQYLVHVSGDFKTHRVAHQMLYVLVAAYML